MGTAPLTSHYPSYSHKKEIEAVLSPRTPDPQLASQLRELSLHICIHAYSWNSNEELQHGRTLCRLRYAHCLQLAVMLLYEKLQAHGTDTQLKDATRGLQTQPAHSSGCLPPSLCYSLPCRPPHHPTRLPQPPRQLTRLLWPWRAFPTCRPDAGGEGPSGHRHGQLLLRETPVQHVG